MRIRTKLLVLLLVMAVLPLAVAVTAGRYTATGLGRHLAAERGEILIDDATRLLGRTVEQYERVLDRDRLSMVSAVRTQAREVELRLFGPPPSEPMLVFHWHDYDDGNVPGVLPSERHFRVDAEGNPTPIGVTYQHQVMFAVAGVEPQSVADDLIRLSTMADAYAFVHSFQPALIHWQYTATPSGVHSSYPGHGGYPDDYDPRTREWYRKASAADDVVWVVMPEVSTRTVVVSLAMAVRDTGGDVAAVTAIDVPLTALFRELDLPESWAAVSQVMLVTPGGAFGTQGTKPVIIARAEYENAEIDWRNELTLERLESEDEAALSALMADAASGRMGVRRMPYNGRPAFWAHGTGDVIPLVIVPQHVVVEQAVEAERYVLDEVRSRQVAMYGLVALIIVLAVAAALASSRVVTSPARRLAQAAARLAQGDYEARVDIRSHDEMQQLGEVFNQIGPQLKEREHIKHALAVAMDVQQNLLPRLTPSVRGLDIAGHSIYCDETGGDYYDYLDIVDLPEGALAVAVGDVMGHGVAAAMLMANARGILRSRCRQPGSLADLLAHMNDLLVSDTDGMRFMTMLLMVVDAPKNIMRWASAGHDRPIVLDPSAGGFIEPVGDGGLPLGIMEDSPYDEYTVEDVRPGQVYIGATDGVWEAKNERDEMFGRERMLEVIRANADGNADQIAAALRREVAAFNGTSPPDDDITFVVVKVREGV